MSFTLKYDFKYKIRPRFSDIDGYGIAHHSKFFCWFEEARFYFLESILEVSKEKSTKMRAPIINLKAEYKKPIVFEDSCIILVTVSWSEFKPLFTFKYQIMDLDEKILFAKAETQHVFTKKSGEILVETPDYIYEKLNHIMN